MKMTHNELRLKVKQSQGRISKLEAKLQEERSMLSELMGNLQDILMRDLGAPITFVRDRKRPVNESYNREEIVGRIRQLRNINTRFAAIASILNREGRRTFYGKTFTTQTVITLHNNSHDLSTESTE